MLFNALKICLKYLKVNETRYKQAKILVSISDNLKNKIYRKVVNF